MLFTNKEKFYWLSEIGEQTTYKSVSRCHSTHFTENENDKDNRDIALAQTLSVHLGLARIYNLL